MRKLLDYIDNQITACLPQAHCMGLCHLIEDDGGQYPSTLEARAKAVYPDERYDVLFYHRLLNATPEPSEDFSFGKRKQRVNTQTIRTVVFIKIDYDLSLIDDMIEALPDTFDIGGSPNEYKFSYVGESISLIRDSNAVWSDEYGDAYKDKYQKVWNIYAFDWSLIYANCNVCI